MAYRRYGWISLDNRSVLRVVADLFAFDGVAFLIFRLSTLVLQTIKQSHASSFIDTACICEAYSQCRTKMKDVSRETSKPTVKNARLKPLRISQASRQAHFRR